MALFKEVKCGRCDRRYSALRSRCPHCGARKNRDGKTAAPEEGARWQMIVGAIVLLVVIVAAIILVTSSLKNKEPEPVGGHTPPPPTSSSGVSSVDGTNPTPDVLPGEEPTPTPTPPPTPTPTPAPVVNAITLNRSDFTLFRVGETFQMEATISPAGTKAELIWISEDPKVATVDENGLVTAVDRGTTIVSASAGGVTQECIVRVNADAPKTQEGETPSGSNGDFRLSHTDVTIHSGQGETFKLSVRNAGEDAVISYSSGNSSVASVTSDGTVKAVGNGNTKITVSVTVGGETVKLECVVYVVT
jgi:hypothetical protein